MIRAIADLRSEQKIGLAIVLVIAYVLGFVNLRLPTVRFSAPLLNTAFFASLQLIPLALLMIAFSVPHWWTRRLLTVLLLPFVVLSGFFGSCSAFEATSILARGSGSFERLERFPIRRGWISIYRTNGGAMTSFGIVARQECELISGLLNVRHIWSQYPAFEAKVEVRPTNRVQFSTPAYGDRRPHPMTQEVELASMWCPISE